MRFEGQRFARDWMGRVVKVTAVMRRTGTGGHRERHVLEKPILGWVVGYTYRRSGTWEGTEHPSDEAPVYVTRGPVFPVVLVCPWPGRRTIDAAPDGIIEMPGEVPTGAPEWDKRAREEARMYASEQARGANGRWGKT